LRGENIDLQLMREYRDAVDYLRTTMETLQRLRKWQLGGSKNGEQLSVLASDRIRRASNLWLEVIADREAGQFASAQSTLQGELGRG
jgi:hypothetical protein